MKPDQATTMEDLACLAAGGDLDALGSLYDTYTDAVIRFLRVKVQDHHLALDLHSATWEKVARSIRKYTHRPGTDGFVGWLFTIANNTVREHYRRAARRPERLDGDLLAYDLIDSDATPEQQWLAKMDAHRIASEVNNLPVAQRRCLLYRFYGGLSVIETAQALGKTTGSVKQLQLRGLGNLQKRLERTLLAPVRSFPDTVMDLDGTEARMEST